MSTRSLKGAVASLLAIAIAGCTTTGIGSGQAVGQNLGAQFSWIENGGVSGRMTAQLSNGEVYQGQFFQITQESRIDTFGPLWDGWGGGFGGRFGYGHRFGYGSRFGWGWGGWGPWGPYDDTITHYTGQVLANLQGPSGYMRCHFALMHPTSGMAGGGLGQCQLPSGTIINAQFPGRNGW